MSMKFAAVMGLALATPALAPVATRAAAAPAATPELPMRMRGVWDLPGHCKDEDSDSRAIVRRDNAVFWETVFLPRRVLRATPTQWAATGLWNEEGEEARGSLTLNLSPDGKVLSYQISGPHWVRLHRCPPGRLRPR